MRMNMDVSPEFPLAENCVLSNTTRNNQIKSCVPGESHKLTHSGHFLMNNWANSPRPDLVRIAHQVYTFDNNKIFSCSPTCVCSLGLRSFGTALSSNAVFLIFPVRSARTCSDLGRWEPLHIQVWTNGLLQKTCKPQVSFQGKVWKTWLSSAKVLPGITDMRDCASSD